MSEVSLDTQVQYLNGVGPHRAALLEKLGITTIEDLLWNLPRDILDFSDVRPPHELTANEPQTVRGIVRDLDGREISKNRTLSSALLDCGTDFVRGNWFNQPWMIKKLQLGQTVLFSGKPKFRMGRWEISHPHVQWLEEGDLLDGASLIVTRYRLTEGLTVQELRRIIAAGLEAVLPLVPDPLPASLRERLELPPIQQALRQVHQPETAEQFRAARHRILFDDLFEFQLGVAMRRRAWKLRSEAPVLPRTAKIDSRIRRLFPFPYTDGQNIAVKEIARDLASGVAMHRLIQADVGAGKTVIAIDAMLTAIAHGWQALLMAPTELLAAQHSRTIEDVLHASRVKRAILTGSLPPPVRKKVLEQIASGDVQLVVGTQSLIQEGVRFRNLGVAVIDEQHKFGVAQRASVSELAGEKSPHVLVMTATPIPRTLCLTQFGDLDLTLIKDRPPGRKAVITSRITGPHARRKAWQFLLDKLKSGRQLYVVCPLIGDSEEIEHGSAAAEQVYRELTTSELQGFRVGIVHGRMKRDERERTMAQFRDRELDVLVATTVVEVGVDVPNATLMVILDAERYGLSQLHQLRGRISRGSFQGYCFLFTESDSPESQSRLSVLERAADGFEVAEQDFDLRGPGDILGTRQHGALPLRFVSELKQADLLESAHTLAQELIETEEFDAPEFAPLKSRVLDRFGESMDLPRSG